MKIATFTIDGTTERVGLLAGGGIIDLNLGDPRLPATLRPLIEAGEEALDRIRALEADAANVAEAAQIPLDAAVLTAPWPRGRIAMAGSNTAQHVLDAISKDPKTWQQHLAAPGEEQAAPMTIEAMTKQLRDAGPWGFWKTLAWVTNPGDELPYPRRTNHLDYEGEVGIVFSKSAKDVRQDQIENYVWGVTLLNDWTDRDAVGPSRPLNYNLPKNFDGSLTIGPFIVIGEFDLQNIDVLTRVNGDVRQSWNTSEMVFSYGECVEHLTRDLTFLPGDILGGGTGAGTAVDIIGRANINTPEADKLFLHPGDVVEISSSRIGSFTNTIAPPA